LGKTLFTGGTVVTAEGSYRADVLVEDGKIVAEGTEDLDANGAETVDATGKLVMPGFIDAHTHMDMPFGGAVTADDWATGTEAATNQARIYDAYPRKGTLAPGADADIVLWDPELSITATVENRHGNVDYTPYEGREFHGGPAAVYVRGNLVYREGEVVGERGSGRFVERSFTATEGLEVRV
jgi:dihydroorotase-like cyclic amidohydrolase